jgi:hypothetical protein
MPRSRDTGSIMQLKSPNPPSTLARVPVPANLDLDRIRLPTERTLPIRNEPAL